VPPRRCSGFIPEQEPETQVTFVFTSERGAPMSAGFERMTYCAGAFRLAAAVSVASLGRGRGSGTLASLPAGTASGVAVSGAVAASAADGAKF
jgi:hypothetical protein